MKLGIAINSQQSKIRLLKFFKQVKEMEMEGKMSVAPPDNLEKFKLDHKK